MSNFAYPEWLLPPGHYDPPPPLDPETRRDLDTQVEEALNSFIEARQKVLHLEPDAYYRKRGREAVDGASAITDRLNGLKAETIANAGTDYERRALEERTSALIGLDQEDVRRHVRRELKEWQRQAMARRIELMRKQAGFNWKDRAALQTYADAAESAARDHGWADGLAPDSDEVQGRVQAARSGVLRSAVEAALNGNHLAEAIALYEQISPHLASGDVQAIGPQIDYARELATGHGYVAPFIKVLPDRLDEIDAVHRAALERNAVDWPDSPSQHATNRYLIDRAFGEHRHDVVSRRADLERQIEAWVDQRRPGDSPWPPRRLWVQLDPDQRREFYQRAKARFSGREIMSDAAPEPLRDGQQYAQASDAGTGKRSWDEQSVGERLATAFERFDQEGKKRGATLVAASLGRRWQQVEELRRRKAAGEQLNVTEERFLLRHRNIENELAATVSRLADAQQRIDRLPRSSALRKLLEATTATQAAAILWDNPGEIAKALGVESVPDALVGVLGAFGLGIGGVAAAFTASGGLQGYANGFVGALAKEGVDVTNTADVVAALQNKELMDRVRGEAATDGAIQAGGALALSLGAAYLTRVRPYGALDQALEKALPIGGEGFHYTFEQYKKLILEKGLREGSYLTTTGQFSPLQAQLDLALDPNRGLRNVLLRLDLNAMRRDGLEIPKPTPVARKFGMPGGGWEIEFPYEIDPKYITVIR